MPAFSECVCMAFTCFCLSSWRGSLATGRGGGGERERALLLVGASHSQPPFVSARSLSLSLRSPKATQAHHLTCDRDRPLPAHLAGSGQDGAWGGGAGTACAGARRRRCHHRRRGDAAVESDGHCLCCVRERRVRHKRRARACEFARVPHAAGFVCVNQFFFFFFFFFPPPLSSLPNLSFPHTPDPHKRERFRSAPTRFDTRHTPHTHTNTPT